MERVDVSRFTCARLIDRDCSRYTFPADPNLGIIDLTEERPFYFNEFSGELSLEFPKATREFKGGILAWVGLSDYEFHDSVNTMTLGSETVSNFDSFWI
jgi:hypothetical protein